MESTSGCTRYIFARLGTFGEVLHKSQTPLHGHRLRTTATNTTNGQKFATSQHLDMSRCWALALRCGKFVVELLWACPLVVSVAGSNSPYWLRRGDSEPVRYIVYLQYVISYLRFWYQVFTWVCERCSRDASSFLSWTLRYFCLLKLRSRMFSWWSVNAVRALRVLLYGSLNSFVTASSLPVVYPVKYHTTFHKPIDFRCVYQYVTSPQIRMHTT